MDIIEYNRSAWDRQIEAARRGDWSLLLTPTKPVPKDWFLPDLHDRDIFCLASGGGQQGPVLAALGARVTVFDNSPRQLASDRMVAEREGLDIRTVQGRMDNLSFFSDSCFDLIFHPVSNCFAPEILPVWRECYRVLRPGGSLLAGFAQPQVYCLDHKDELHYLRFSLPYSDLTSITPEERAQKYGPDAPLEFSHTFTEQIGGQMEAGFHLVGLYEDVDPGEPASRFMPFYMATRAMKP